MHISARAKVASLHAHKPNSAQHHSSVTTAPIGAKDSSGAHTSAQKGPNSANTSASAAAASTPARTNQQEHQHQRKSSSGAHIGAQKGTQQRQNHSVSSSRTPTSARKTQQRQHQRKSSSGAHTSAHKEFDSANTSASAANCAYISAHKPAGAPAAAQNSSGAHTSCSTQPREQRTGSKPAANWQRTGSELLLAREQHQRCPELKQRREQVTTQRRSKSGVVKRTQIRSAQHQRQRDHSTHRRKDSNGASTSAYMS